MAGLLAGLQHLLIELACLGVAAVNLGQRNLAIASFSASLPFEFDQPLPWCIAALIDLPPGSSLAVM
jgi:hypothetical protein